MNLKEDGDDEAAGTAAADAMDVDAKGDAKPGPDKDYFVGSSEVNYRRDDMEVGGWRGTS